MKSAWLPLAIVSMSLTAQVEFSRQRPRGEPQTGKASIEGTVIDASTREPVKKASVTLMGRVTLNAVTDASGHFAFRELPAGPYAIQAQSDRYPSVPPGVEDGHMLPFPLAADEQKRGVSLTLIPGAAIRGRVVDDEGSPMQRCNVSAMRFQNTESGRTLQSVAAAQSDDIGEYRISKVLPGKYYILARCYQTVQLPHALIRRGSTLDIPVLTYAPQFYPGVPDLAGAVRVEAAVNAGISGIDFRMSAAAGVTVPGHAGPMPADRNLQIALQPKDPVRREWQWQNARINGSTGEFQFPNVAPGSYELIATGSGDDRSYFARLPVEIGVTPLDPIKVELAPAPSISGTISIEGDVKVPITSLQVRMDPLDRMQQGRGDAPQGEVQSDGTFTLKSVVPGRWRLYVNNAPGYLKSVMRGDQEVSATDLEIGPSAGPVKIVIGTKFAEVNAVLSAPPSDSGQYSAIVWPVQDYNNQRIDPQGRAKLNLPPGKYHVCAVAGGQPWTLMQNHALLKALEGVCEAVEVSEGDRKSVRMRLIAADELKRLIEKLEE